MSDTERLDYLLKYMQVCSNMQWGKLSVYVYVWGQGLEDSFDYVDIQPNDDMRDVIDKAIEEEKKHERRPD